MTYMTNDLPVTRSRTTDDICCALQAETFSEIECTLTAENSLNVFHNIQEFKFEGSGYLQIFSAPSCETIGLRRASNRFGDARTCSRSSNITVVKFGEPRTSLVLRTPRRGPNNVEFLFVFSMSVVHSDMLASTLL